MSSKIFVCALFAFLFHANLALSILIPQPSGHLSEKSSNQKQLKQKKMYSIRESTIAGKIILDSILIAFSRFDINGKLIEDVKYDNNGTLVSKSEFGYNDMGKKTKAILYNTQGNMVNNMGFKYDKQGNLTAEALYENGDEIEYEKIYKYNESGKKIMEIERKEEQGIEKKTIYNYDERGNVIETKNFFGKDSLRFRFTYKYDLRNNLIEEVRYDGEKQEWKFEYLYNDANKKAKENHYYLFQTSNSFIVYQYDEQQRLIEETTFDSNNKIIQKNKFSYLNGKIKAEEIGNKLTEFEYDVNGNKIQEKTSVNKIAQYIKQFDKYGNLTSVIYYKLDKSISYLETYLYDEKGEGKLLKTSRFNSKKILIDEIEYQYNHFGLLVAEVKKSGDVIALSKNKYVYQYYE